MSGHEDGCPRAGAALNCGGCNRALRRAKVARLRRLDEATAEALGRPDVTETLPAVHYAVWVYGGVNASTREVARSLGRLGWVLF